MARRFVALLLLVTVGLVVIWYLGSQKTVHVDLFAACFWLSSAGWGV